MSPGEVDGVTCTEAWLVAVAPCAPVAVRMKVTVPTAFKVTTVDVCPEPIGTFVPFWVRLTLVALVVVHLRVTDCPAVTVVGVAVSVAVGPPVGGGAVTVAEPDAAAAVVPGAPVAVRVKVVVPTAFNVNCIPGELRGLPSRRTEVPFWLRATDVAF